MEHGYQWQDKDGCNPLDQNINECLLSVFLFILFLTSFNALVESTDSIVLIVSVARKIYRISRAVFLFSSEACSQVSISCCWVEDSVPGKNNPVVIARLYDFVCPFCPFYIIKTNGQKNLLNENVIFL